MTLLVGIFHALHSSLKPFGDDKDNSWESFSLVGLFVLTVTVALQPEDPNFGEVRVRFPRGC